MQSFRRTMRRRSLLIILPSANDLMDVSAAISGISASAPADEISAPGSLDSLHDFIAETARGKNNISRQEVAAGQV